MENLPDSLDRKAWVLWGLQHSYATFRELSLREILVSRTWDEFSSILDTLSANEESEPCRELIKNIRRGKLFEKQVSQLREQNISFSPERYRENSKFDLDVELECAKKLKERPSEEVLERWRDSIRNNWDWPVNSIGFALLSRFGNDRDVGLAEIGLSSKDAMVGITAIDLLARKSDEFTEKIFVGLISFVYPIRFHAIEKLRSIDPEEALEHLKPLLRNEEPEVRLQAISNLLLFPFSLSEPLVLEFLSCETIPLLMVFAAFAIFMNPHPDLPIKLSEMFYVSKSVKRQIVKLTLSKVLESIQQTGILKEDPDEYLSRIKGVLQDRKKSYLKKIAIANLADRDDETRFTAVQTLLKCEQDTDVVAALKNLRCEEKNEEILQVLQSFLGEEAPDPRAVLECSTKEDFFANREKFRQILQADSPREKILKTLNFYERFGSIEDGKQIVPFIKHANAAIVAQAIRVLGKIDVDSLHPFLNSLISKDHPRISAAALEVFVQIDKEAALQYLKAMLKSPLPTVRKRALSNFIFVDYPSVEQILLEVFSGERIQEVRVQMGFIIASNPTSNGVQAIYNACHDSNFKEIPELIDLWEFARDGAIPQLAPNTATLERLCKIAFEKNLEKTGKPKPKYAFKRKKDTQPQESGFLSQKYWIGFAAALCVALFLMARSNQPDSDTPNLKPEAPIKGHLESFSFPANRLKKAPHIPIKKGIKDTRRIRRNRKRIPLPIQ